MINTNSKTDFFFKDLLAYWHQASNILNGPAIVDIELCGFHLRLQFTSRNLANQLTQAFAHCPTPQVNSHPDFTIYTMSGALDKSLPKLPWHHQEMKFPRGEIRSRLDHNLIASYVDTRILYIYHRNLNQAVCWLKDDSPVPCHEQAAPFRSILHWWLREKGWIMVHGAGIGYNNRGILLMGKGGSGKSTLAISLARENGFQYLGDDYCALKVIPPFSLSTIYSTAKLTPETCRLLNFPTSRQIIEGSNKHLFFLANQLNCPRTSLPLHFLALPVRTPSTTKPSTKLLNRAQSAIHLSVSSIYQLPHAGEVEFKQLAAVARSLPGWAIKVPENHPGKVATTIQRIFN